MSLFGSEVRSETISAVLSWPSMKAAKPGLSAMAYASDQLRMRSSANIRALARVGVLVKIAGSQNPVRYRLAQNLGAKAPTVSKAEVVFDPNSKSIVGTPALEVAP